MAFSLDVRSEIVYAGDDSLLLRAAAESSMLGINCMTNHALFVSILASVSLLLPSRAWGAGPTPIGGSQSGTLYLTNSPYVVISDLFVSGGQTLSIEPGVVVQFTNVNIGAFIGGALIARGTSGSPILFTSDKGVKPEWRLDNS